MSRPKKLIVLYLDINGLSEPAELTFCMKHLRSLGRFTGVLAGSSEDEEKRELTELEIELEVKPECDPCRFKGDIGYLRYLIEMGTRLEYSNSIYPSDEHIDEAVIKAQKTLSLVTERKRSKDSWEVKMATLEALIQKRKEGEKHDTVTRESQLP